MAAVPAPAAAPSLAAPLVIVEDALPSPDHAGHGDSDGAVELQVVVGTVGMAPEAADPDLVESEV